MNLFPLWEHSKDDLEAKVDDLNCADDGESSQQSHGASNSW